MNNTADGADFICLKGVRQVLDQVNGIILGKEREVKEIMTAFLANGHILLEDIPGVGKTTMAIAFSKSMALDYRRVQFTPDVLPSDLTGFSIYRREDEQFVYRPGSVFCNLLLADEINRTSPKTQSALLEVMEERHVTVDGVTRSVGDPFFVIATQNPTGSAGTQYLPQAQVDRFMIRLSLGYPDFENELAMAKEGGNAGQRMAIRPVLSREALLQAQKDVENVYMKDEVCRYLLKLITATRQHPEILIGASPRATIALVKMAKAWAWMDGRDYVTPADVCSQFPYVVSHRIVLKPTLQTESADTSAVISQILEKVKKPSLGGRGL